MQSQNLGLKCNAIKHADDVRYPAAGRVDVLHCANDLADHFATLHRQVGSAGWQLISLSRTGRRWTPTELACTRLSEQPRISLQFDGQGAHHTQALCPPDFHNYLDGGKFVHSFALAL